MVTLATRSTKILVHRIKRLDLYTDVDAAHVPLPSLVSITHLTFAVRSSASN